MANSELACVYAALILADDDVAVTPEKITTILKVIVLTCVCLKMELLKLGNCLKPLLNCRLLVLMLSPIGLASSPR